MSARDVRVLAFHAGYRCRNSGVCCTSSWPIPIEADRLERAQAAIEARGLAAVRPGANANFVYPPDAPAETPAVLATCEGACVFHDPAGHCAIQSTLGHDALPLACRQFPRVSVTDPRGVSVTLSHYCPTAASLLRGDGDAGDPIVTNVAAFPPDGEYIGLDATSVMPPLLRESVLMDWESWWEFERLSAVALLNAGSDAASALAAVRGAATSLYGWSPSEGSLITAVRDGFNAPAAIASTSPKELVTEALDAIPPDFRQQASWTSSTATDDRAARRFLAAHAFANWQIHSEKGLAAWLRSIETAYAFITAGAGVRHADLVLRHLS